MLINIRIYSFFDLIKTNVAFKNHLYISESDWGIVYDLLGFEGKNAENGNRE